DPPGFWYASGRSGSVIPSDGLSALVAAALAFHDDFLILEPNGPRYLGPIYDGTEATPNLELVAVVGELRVYRIAALAPRGFFPGTAAARGDRWLSQEPSTLEALDIRQPRLGTTGTTG